VPSPLNHARMSSVGSVMVAGWLGPSAVSADMLAERFPAFAREVLMDPVHELVSRQRPLRLNDRPLTVQPARLDRVEPGALHRQTKNQESESARSLSPVVIGCTPL